MRKPYPNGIIVIVDLKSDKRRDCTDCPVYATNKMVDYDGYSSHIISGSSYSETINKYHLAVGGIDCYWCECMFFPAYTDPDPIEIE